MIVQPAERQTEQPAQVGQAALLLPARDQDADPQRVLKRRRLERILDAQLATLLARLHLK